MKKLLCVLAVISMTGCASWRHKPPSCEGPVHRINPAPYYQPTPPASAASTAEPPAAAKAIAKESNDVQG